MTTLSSRKQYAKKCLIEGRTNTRAFDNCFEMGDGDKVVRFLMGLCALATPENLQRANDLMAQGVIYNGPEYKWCRKIQDAQRLMEAIKRGGSWDYWVYFMEHGTYQGYQAQDKAA